MSRHASRQGGQRALPTLVRALLALVLILSLGWTTGLSPAPVGAASIVVTSTEDNINAGEVNCDSIMIDDLDDGDGEVTLREAICAANNTDGDDAITFALPGTAPWEINFDISEALIINSNLTITGPGPGQEDLLIDADGSSQVFLVQSGTVGISLLTIIRGQTSLDGGGIANNGNLTLTDVTVELNIASDEETYGGGIANSGTLNLIRTTVSDNSADYGGGIANFGTLTMTGGELSINTMTWNGGGLYNEGVATLTDVLIERNRAESFVSAGGGIYNVRYGPIATSPLTLTRVYIEDNAAYYGGGIAIDNRTKQTQLTALAVANAVTIESSTINANTACIGGGIRTDEWALAISNSTISDNNALDGSGEGDVDCEPGFFEGKGGGIAADSALEIINSTISGNTADDNGGGLYLRGNEGGEDLVTIAFSTITGNRSDDNDDESVDGGGGIFYQALVPSAVPSEIGGVILTNSILAGNFGPTGQEDCGGPVSTDGDNIFGEETGCPDDGTGDILTTDITTVLNTTLANNGGPTMTHALVANSPAIDNADDEACDGLADQRGNPRPSGEGCDIGAYEFQVALLVLTVQTEGTGEVTVSPTPASSTGTLANMTYQYPPGTVVTLTVNPGAGQVFARWTIDGVGPLPYGKGWASPLTITLDTAHTAKATFAARPSFSDVPSSHPSYTAITELAARGIIKGYTAAGCAGRQPPVAAPCYGPDDQTERAQTAALLVRLLGLGSGNTGNGGFTDLEGLDPDLNNAVLVVSAAGIMQGYGGGKFGPYDKTSQLQTILVISRGFVAKGYWTRATIDDPTIYPNLALSASERLDLVTYVKNAGALPGFANNTQRAPLDLPAPRSWTAEVLWLALDGYFSTDEPGKGGFVP